MSTFNPIEGIDYIFDRYAFLSIPQDADIATIDKAIKAKKIANHPDNFVRAEDAERRTAQQKFIAAENCGDILRNPDTRSAYDTKLAWFHTHHPSAVSKDGRQIIDLNSQRMRVDLDRILAPYEGLSADVAGYINQHSGHNPEKLARKERLYRKDPNDPDLRDEYADALTAKLVYVIAQEDQIWQRAGIDGRIDHDLLEVQEPADYPRLIQSNVDRIITQAIPDNITTRGEMVALGMAKPPLLLAGSNTNSGAELTEIDPQQIIAQAQQNFHDRTHALTALAHEKQQIVAALLPLMPVEYLTPTRHSGTAILHLLDAGAHGGEPTVRTSFLIDENAYSLHDISMNYQGMSVSTLRQHTQQDTHITFIPNPEITDIMVPVLYVAECHGRILENAPPSPQDKQAYQKPPPPAPEQPHRPGAAP